MPCDPCGGSGARPIRSDIARHVENLPERGTQEDFRSNYSHLIEPRSPRFSPARNVLGFAGLIQAADQSSSLETSATKITVAAPTGCIGSDVMKSTVNRSVLALAAVLAVAGASQASAQQKLKSYESGNKEFWTHPPDDWFLGDETEAQKGLAPPSGPPTGASEAELAALLNKIKLPAGFKIEVYAPGVLAARQMAWGDNGTLFVGSFGLGNVYAITDKGGKKEVKTIIKGLKMPTGIAFKDGALYVIDIDKLLRYDNAEANLDKMPEAKVVYDDMPSYVAHGWKYLAADKDGWFYVPFGPPFNIGIPPTSLSQIRRVDPKTGNAELVALGVRNSVGGDVDPGSGNYWVTENDRYWIGD